MFLSSEALASLLSYSTCHGIPALKSILFSLSRTSPHSGGMKSSRKAAQRPHTHVHHPQVFQLQLSSHHPQPGRGGSQRPLECGGREGGSGRVRCLPRDAGRASCQGRLLLGGLLACYLQAAPCTQTGPTCSPSCVLGVG